MFTVGDDWVSAEVVVNGVRYVPESAAARVGLAFTTHNRPDMLERALAAVRQHTPADFVVVVVDDGSNTPAAAPTWARLVRHDKPLGIPAAKNRCLAELAGLGCREMFLFDDDTWPAAPDWWRPFVESPEPHLQYNWLRFAKDDQPVSGMAEVYRSPGLVAYTHSMGCLLYLTSDVLRRVGGMRVEFGVGMHEHIEWSRRIHNAGLTSFAHQSPPAADDRVWAGDRHKSVQSSITVADRQQLLERNDQLLESLVDDQSHVPCGHLDVVLTCLFANQPDPQRGTRLEPDPKLAGNLLRSLPGGAVVLCDFDAAEPGFVRVPVGGVSPYLQRWVSYRQWLIAHPEARWVWCVDATDVEALRPPFDGMLPGTLYAGWENGVVGCPWMLGNHEGSRDWVTANSDKNLLNAGVAGGDRATLLEFTGRLVRHWLDSREDQSDMAVFNRAAYDMPRLVTGPRVATLFKANESNDWSVWKHK